MNLRAGLAAVTCFSAVTTSAFAGSFEVIGPECQFFPRAISADGSTIVGDGLVGLGTSTWNMSWRKGTGLTEIGTVDLSVKSAVPTAVTPDGSTVVGLFQDDADNRTAFRWTAPGGYQLLTPPAGVTMQNISGVSANGSIMSGQGTFPSGTSGFRWTSGTGFQALAPVAGQPTPFDATAISADGLTIAGNGWGPDGVNAFTWTAASGIHGIPMVAGSANMYPVTLSSDGSSMVGNSDVGVFRYAGGQVSAIGLPAGIYTQAYVTGGTADLNTLVVNALVAAQPQLGATPFIWTSTGGFTPLSELLSANGIDTGTYIPTEIQGISADGSTLFGRGLENGIQPSGWVAIVPEPSTTTLLFGSLAAAFARRRRTN